MENVKQKYIYRRVRSMFVRKSFSVRERKKSTRVSCALLSACQYDGSNITTITGQRCQETTKREFVTNINMFYSISVDGLIRLKYKNLLTKITYSTIRVDKKLKIYWDIDNLLIYVLFVCSTLIFLDTTWNTNVLQELVLRF